MLRLLPRGVALLSRPAVASRVLARQLPCSARWLSTEQSSAASAPPADGVASNAPPDAAEDVAASTTSDTSVFLRLLKSRMAKDQPDQVIELFNERAAAGAELPVQAWSVLFSAYQIRGESKATVLARFGEMKEKGHTPDAETYDAVLACCAAASSGDSASDVSDAVALREEMVAASVQPSLSTFESLITVYLGAGDVPSARTVMEEMHLSRVAGRYRASIAYLSSCLTSGQLDEAVTYLNELHANQRPPGGNDMRRLLKGFTSKRHLQGAMTSAEMMLELQDTFDPMPLIVTMANLHAFDEQPARAELLLSKCVKLIRPDLQTGAYWNKDRLHVLTRCLPLLPDVHAKMSVLNVLNLRRHRSRELMREVIKVAEGGVGAVDDAYHALEDLANTGVPVAVGTINSIILMCGHVRDLDRAVQTFEAIKKPPFGLAPDVDSFNALMMAAFREKEVGAVANVHVIMQEEGVRPNGETFRILIMSKLHQNNVVSAHELLQQAADAGVPAPGQYSALISFHLGIRTMGVNGARRPDTAKALALRDAATELGLQLNTRVKEDLERAEAELAQRAKASSSYEEEVAPVMAAAAAEAAGAAVSEAAAAAAVGGAAPSGGGGGADSGAEHADSTAAASSTTSSSAGA